MSGTVHFDEERRYNGRRHRRYSSVDTTETYVEPLPNRRSLYIPRPGDGDGDSDRKKGISAISYRHFSFLPNATNIDEPAIVDPVGLEPGIDVKTTAVQLDDAVGSDIIVVDYAPDHQTHQHIEVGANISGIGDSLVLDLVANRPEWSAVRWICVNGLSWEAIGPITDHFSLHPLAIEDMLDIPQRTKMDVFANHVSCCFPLHLLTPMQIKPGKVSRMGSTFKRLFGRGVGKTYVKEPDSRSKEPVCIGDHCVASVASLESQTSLQGRLADIPSRSLYQWDRGDNTAAKYGSSKMSQLPRSFRHSTVTIEQVSLFMTKDTVITFFEKSASKVQKPIMNRLSSPETLLRQSADPAILAQAIIDTCVDLIAPIVTEYGRRLSDLQMEAIRSPTLNHTRALHILSTDLTILRNTIGSITPMVNSFRHKSPEKHGLRDSTSSDQRFFSNFVSDVAALYFGDVADHAMLYNRHLSIMSEQARGMTTLIFNTISIQSSDAVRLLSLVTVVFLPLSFLTGYFGMNFTKFDSLNNDVNYYWAIAAPFSIGLMLFLTYSWAHEKFLELKHWVLSFK